MEPHNETTESSQATPSPEVSPESLVRPPKRGLPSWIVIVLPLVLLVCLVGQDYLGPRNSEPPITTPSPETTPEITETPTPYQVKPTPVPTSTAQSSLHSPDATKRVESYVIYVPGPDAMLHRQVVKEHITQMEDMPMSGVSSSLKANAGAIMARGNHALSILFKQPDNVFPKNTPLPHMAVQGDILTVDFPKDFQNANLWHSEKIAQLAIYSLVNTLNDDYLSSAPPGFKVQLLIDGKPVETLGELDASEPFEPNPQMVAKS